MHRATPCPFELALEPASPVVPQQIIRIDAWLVAKELNDLVRGAPAIQRLNQRLNNGSRTVISTRVRPSLKVVGLMDVPLRKFGGLVSVESQVDRQSRLIEFSQ